MAASKPRCKQPESMSDVGERRGTPNDGLYASNQELSQWIEVEMCPSARQIEGLVTIPASGVPPTRSSSQPSVATSRFPAAGTCRLGLGFVPGDAESACEQRQGTRRHGN